jgi:putative lipoic acid-binding regulatory protein
MSSANDPESESPLKFPCSFPIKVMGRHEGNFESAVVAMVSSHFGPLPEGSVRSRASSNGRFVSVTVTVVAESRAQLDDVYRTLTASEQVLFVL